jgi:hypothetical protein
MLRFRTVALFLGLSPLLTIGSGCAAPWTPPTPSEILAKPGQSTMNDGHFKITGHVTSGAYTIDVTGDGVMVLKPKYALSMHFQGSLGQIPFAVQEIEINGTSYSRVGSDKWTEAEAKGEVGNTSGATGTRLAGDESLAVGKSWHLRAVSSSGQPFDAWVRESDGYLAKYSGTTDTGSISIEFDRYNTNAPVSAPPASEIKPPAKQLTGSVGDALQLNGLTVTIVTADVNAKPANQFITPKAGDRFVVVQVLYENTGSDAVSYSPFDWKLIDSSGFTYTDAFSGIDQQLNSGNLPSGGRVRGYVSYEVPQSAGGLNLKLQHGDDTATIAIGQ